MIPTPQVAPLPLQAEQDTIEPAGVAQTPARNRIGQSRLALAVKALLRPIFKFLYYTIHWMQLHKLSTLLASLLLLASIFATTYFASGQLPFSSNTDDLRQSVQNNSAISPDVQAWLLALRSGDLNTMLSVQKAMNTSMRPPDSSLYVLQFSEKYAPVKWTNIAVTSMNKAPDGLIDTFIEIDISAIGNANSVNKSVVLWHFSTTPSGNIFLLDYVSGRTV